MRRRRGAERQRVWLWAASGALSLACAALYGQRVGSFDDPTAWRVVLFAGMGLGMLGLVAAAPRWLDWRRELAAVGLLALACRAALLPTAASDDVHRYLWEGKLVAGGLSPYAARGDSEAWADLRDEQWELMNNKDKLTAYPPGALLVFGAAAAARYEVWSFKLLFVLAELGALAAVGVLLRRRGLPPRHLGWAAFNPVLLVSFAGEGHFDALLLLALALGALALERRQLFWAGVALGVATQMKVVAVVAAPWLIWRGGWRAGGGFALAAAALCVPFWGSLEGFAAGLRDFGTQRWFNGPLHVLLVGLGWERESLGWLLPTSLLGALAAWLWARGSRDDFAGHWQWMAGALLLASPTAHFWYLSWLAVFLPLRPSLWWVSLSVSQCFYFAVWGNAAAGGWDLRAWQSALVWGPGLALLALGLARGLDVWRARRGGGRRAEGVVAPGTGWLVVVPSLNAAGSIEACLASLAPQLGPEDCLVVSDAGSTDGTVEIARRMGARVTQSERGRGNQILAGLRTEKTRYALVAHADAVAPAGLLAALRAWMSSGVGCVGGACGQRFAEAGFWPFRLVELLNELRAGLTGISFGDQLQFFDRLALGDEQYPGQPLMEDVELSLRLRALGEVCYLGLEAEVSGSKWRRAPRRRFWLVVSLVARYAWARARRPSRVGSISAAYYREYYGEGS